MKSKSRRSVKFTSLAAKEDTAAVCLPWLALNKLFICLLLLTSKVFKCLLARKKSLAHYDTDRA